MEESGITYKILVGNPAGKKKLQKN